MCPSVTVQTQGCHRCVGASVPMPVPVCPHHSITEPRQTSLSSTCLLCSQRCPCSEAQKPEQTKRAMRRALSVQQVTGVPQQAELIRGLDSSNRHRSHKGSVGFSPCFGAASMALLILC